MSVFKLQIVRSDDGVVATLPAGGELEKDLVEYLADYIVKEQTIFSLDRRAQIVNGLNKAMFAFKKESIKAL
jgi:hypothetical protein